VNARLQDSRPLGRIAVAADHLNCIQALRLGCRGGAKLGREQGVEVALQNVFDALDCKGCHDAFRPSDK
jgi:hypothetical protein